MGESQRTGVPPLGPTPNIRQPVFARRLTTLHAFSVGRGLSAREHTLQQVRVFHCHDDVLQAAEHATSRGNDIGAHCRAKTSTSNYTQPR